MAECPVGHPVTSDLPGTVHIQDAGAGLGVQGFGRLGCLAAVVLGKARQGTEQAVGRLRILAGERRLDAFAVLGNAHVLGGAQEHLFRNQVQITGCVLRHPGGRESPQELALRGAERVGRVVGHLGSDLGLQERWRARSHAQHPGHGSRHLGAGLCIQLGVPGGGDRRAQGGNLLLKKGRRLHRLAQVLERDPGRLDLPVHLGQAGACLLGRFGIELGQLQVFFLVGDLFGQQLDATGIGSRLGSELRTQANQFGFPFCLGDQTTGHDVALHFQVLQDLLTLGQVLCPGFRGGRFQLAVARQGADGHVRGKGLALRIDQAGDVTGGDRLFQAGLGFGLRFRALLEHASGSTHCAGRVPHGHAGQQAHGGCITHAFQDWLVQREVLPHLFLGRLWHFLEGALRDARTDDGLGKTGRRLQQLAACQHGVYIRQLEHLAQLAAQQTKSSRTRTGAQS